MDHNETRHSLSDYLDGSLAPADQEAVEGHLRTCTECSEALRELRKTVEHVKQVEQVEPPAWMTQKIMARVRVEKENQGLLQRIFFPRSVKLPLEALGVALLAVTSFVIYQNMQPADRSAEAPSPAYDRTAPDQRSQEPAPKDKQTPLMQAVPQKPEYKALEMKQAYESPPPPAPDKSQPAPAAAPEERTGSKTHNYCERMVTPPGPDQDAPAASPLSRKTEPQSPSSTPPPEPLKGNASPPAGISDLGEGTADTAARKRSKRAFADGFSEAKPHMIVAVESLSQTSARIEKVVKELSGMVVRRETSERTMTISVSVPADRRRQLLDAVKAMGRVQESVEAKNYADTLMVLRFVQAGPGGDAH